MDRHTDWIWPLRWVPRSWTTFRGDPPQVIFGNTKLGDHLDITPPSTYVITWPPYVTFRTQSGWHFRIGARWDYSTESYQFPSIALKKII